MIVRIPPVAVEKGVVVLDLVIQQSTGLLWDKGIQQVTGPSTVVLLGKLLVLWDL